MNSNTNIVIVVLSSSSSSSPSSLDTYLSSVFSLAKPKEEEEKKSLFYDTSVKISACPFSLSEDGPTAAGLPRRM